MAIPALRLTGVTRRFGDRVAVADVSFSVASGESIGYLGPNGAGKSTTLKLLTGLLSPDSGSVEILGVPAGPRSARSFGALIEAPGLPPFLRGRDLLTYVAQVRGTPADGVPAEVRRAAGEMGVADRLDDPVGRLSTGLLRRMLIATTLIGDPPILLLDEPTLGLDPAARYDLRRVLRGLHESGHTLLLSTHLLDDVEAICDRVLFLRDGHLVGDEPVRDRERTGSHARTLRLEFAGPVTTVALSHALGSGASVQAGGDQEATVGFEGDDLAQAALLKRVVDAGLPLLNARPALDPLTQRYLDTVGREEVP